MLTSKQRAALRALASDCQPLFQLGKEGLSETFLAACDTALQKRELIKITVLKTSPLSAHEAGAAVAEKLHAEFVAAIGGKFILYRYNKENKEHVPLG